MQSSDKSSTNWNSRELTHGWQLGIRAFYWGLGFSDEDFDKPQVGIGVPLLEGNICNAHAYALAQDIEDGCREAGLLGFKFGVPGISDNITQGHEGGNASLISRNIIASNAEMVTSAHKYDALIGLHHCDKNGPGFAMALARLNYPGFILSGGSIAPGCHKGKPITILDPYEAQAKLAIGEIEASEVQEIVRNACPGPGGCGIAASFNTWGIAMEAIGLMPPYSSSIPAEDPLKAEEVRQAGNLVKILLEKNIRPRDILTFESFRNATVAIAAAGGSTNGILHLLALACECGIDFNLQHIQEILRRTPVLCQFAPRGRGTMVDLHRLGGTPMLLKHLWRSGLLNPDCLTVTGLTLGQNLALAPDLPANQELITTMDKPFREYADMQVCFGNIAPNGIVFKASSLKSASFHGRAACFSDSRDIIEAVQQHKITPGTVVVLRGLGPVASGMPEVLVATSALGVPELYGKVAMISDTRVSGVSHGAIGVHCSPEAAVGGPIAWIQDGDRIEFDLLRGTIHCDVPHDEWIERSQKHVIPPQIYERGYMAEFAATVSQAHHGCVPNWVLQRPRD
ncbi:MAG: dihydroxy-acid dehydratase [Verrucomicrobia bacterium]|nr:dihydroxy-acid dehydratase [Verrucomicrobiota bacterium]